MRIIFLDIDGVLNSGRFFRDIDVTKRREEQRAGSTGWWSVQLDSDCVERLNHIIDATDALVVVSSSWRLGKTVQDLQAILNAKGFRGLVLGRTPNKGHRGEEISAWLDGENTVSSFVVLDDCAKEHVEPVGSRLVSTTCQEGLLDEHVERAIEILRDPSCVPWF